MATAETPGRRNGGTDQQVHVFLRPLGSPLPLGLSGLAIASLLTAGVDLGWVPVGESSQMGFLLLVAVVPMQLLACAFAFPARDGAAASGVGVLAATWAAYGLTKLATPAGSTSHALGLVLLVSAGALAGIGAAQVAGGMLPGVAILLAALRFAVSGVYELTASEGWQNAAGAVGLAVAAIAICFVWTITREETRTDE